MADLQKIQFNNRTILTPSGDSFVAIDASDRLFPRDMDFIYLANDYNGTNIPNRATNTDMGSYNKNGTITKNGSGSDCYLSNGLVYSNFLYIDITSARLNAMKASNSTYTYFVRVYAPSNGIGGIICFRNTDDNYKYMIRCNSNKIQVGPSGDKTLTLNPNKVFKITINDANAVVNDLDGNTQTVNITTTRVMGTRMTSFLAGVNNYAYRNEGKLDRFYGIAGIARSTTSLEDAKIRAFLLSQGV